MLLVDEEAALAAIPVIARSDPAGISDVLRALHRVAAVAGPLTGERAARPTRIEELFAEASATRPTDAPAPPPASHSKLRGSRPKTARILQESADTLAAAKAG